MSERPILFWTEGVPVEDAAMEQLHNVASLPIIGPHIAVMPDVHYGIGATIGSVIPTRAAIIPSAVSVDLGCGVTAFPSNLKASDLPDTLAPLRSAIEAAIPVGFSNHDNATDDGINRWEILESTYNDILTDDSDIAPRRPPLNQIGTLGGGNHFIEVCLDQNDTVWLMLHSGSRGIGNRIGTYFIDIAKKCAERDGVSLPDKNLAWFNDGTDEFRRYIRAMLWAQDYASHNRQSMMTILKSVMTKSFPGFDVIPFYAVDCHHNYATKQVIDGESLWVTRKGALSAQEGELGIIPGSMGAKSFIVRGKGNVKSYCSCSHGAGRAMGRKEAKRKFTIEQHIAATTGVECRKDSGVIDETPAAYKNIDSVMAAQRDLVDVVYTLKQVLCVKG